MLRGGLEHEGFSMIEIVSNCHTAYGRLNKLGSHLDMLHDFRDRAVEFTSELNAGQARCEGKIVTGLLYSEERDGVCAVEAGTADAGEDGGEVPS